MNIYLLDQSTFGAGKRKDCILKEEINREWGIFKVIGKVGKIVCRVV